MTGGDDFPDWGGDQAIVVASGPSLTTEDVAACRGRGRILVVNNCHELAPFADAIYACDGSWWNRYGATVTLAERWTSAPTDDAADKLLLASQLAAAGRFGLKVVRGCQGTGLGRGTVIHWGGNSGYQAVQLAHLFGARRIVLLGFDYQATGGRSHWHGDHADGLKQLPRDALKVWAGRFEVLVRDLRQAGTAVVNATRQSALRLPRVELEEALAWHGSDRSAAA